MTKTRRRYERRVGERAARAQAGREREFANLYRVNDAARGLSDEDFGEVLKFTRAAFQLAMAFPSGKGDAGKRRSKAESA